MHLNDLFCRTASSEGVLTVSRFPHHGPPDTDVEPTGTSLDGCKVVLGVTGGIAAVETVRLARALQEKGARLTVIMTPSAQRIITPLAVRWASQAEVITDWDGDLTALNEADAVWLHQRHGTLASHPRPAARPVDDGPRLHGPVKRRR